MKQIQGGLIAAAIATVGLTGVAIAPKAAIAQAAYGSYIGVGPTIGIVNDNRGNGQNLGGVIAFRYKFLEVPLSLRTQALIGSDGGTAVIPTVSYDFPINWQTDAYVGAGVAFGSGDSPSPIGDKTSFAIQPGIDYVIPNSSTVVFGNAIIAFDAYRNGGGAAFSLQGGLGLQF